MFHHIRISHRRLLAASLCLAIGSAAALPVVAAEDIAGEPAVEVAAELVKRPLALNDLLAWNSLRNPQLSDDGNWFAYRVGTAEGNGEIRIKRIDGDTEYSFPSGAFSRGGQVAISDNSGWLAFTINPDAKANKRKSPKKPAGGKVGLVDLATGTLTKFDDVQQFQFAGEKTTWLAMHKTPVAGANGNPGRGPRPMPGGKGPKMKAPTGRDLILRQLSSGDEFNIGNVSEFAFDEDGERLAWIVDSNGQSGNGVQIRDLESDVVRVLDSGKARYKHLNWSREGDALTLLKGVSDKGYEDLLYSVIGVKKPGAKKAVKTVYDPREDESFPEGFTISANQAPAWDQKQTTLVFGIAEVERKETPAKPAEKPQPDQPQDSKESVEAKAEKAPDTADQTAEKVAEKVVSLKTDDKAVDSKPAPKIAASKPPAGKLTPEDKPGLVLWHWNDDRLQSQQQKEASRDKSHSYLANYQVKTKQFVRIADEQVPSVMTKHDHRWGVGIDNAKYERMGNLDGRHYQDIYRVNLKTGERSLALEKIRWSNGLSPNGRYFLFYREGDYHTMELASGKIVNITQGVKTSFINTEDDHNQIDPPRPALGWAKGEKWVLISDGWDIWQVSATGGKAKNLTLDGKKQQIRYSSLNTYDKDARFDGIDLSRDLYLNAYGEWTKKSGIARLRGGRPGVEMLQWDDAFYRMPIKAEDTNVFAYTRQTPDEFADFYSVDRSFNEPVRLTEANPQQGEYEWTAGARLVDFTTDKGVKLQASLTLPANYQPGQKYPTIVYIYEKRSQELNRYAMPGAGGFNLSYYTSNGYAVLQPDIVYEVDNPGMSAVWAVLPALKAAVATGVVDEERVGLHGHSWGGYQSSFLVTQTDAFAAVVTGAPLTNMISMYGANYWNSGMANSAIFESLQGRFSSHYLDIPEAYTRNSPVYFADKVNTPMVLLHNDKDGAVDWNQGVEYYNILRRLGKEVVMLQYVGENHGVRKPANRKDYTVRMKEFFDHHLKGADAPDWWQNGVPHLEMDEHVQERVTAMKAQAKKGPTKEAKAAE